MGLGVPKDVSVVGFDDAEGVDLLLPPLTTMRQPLSTMAEVAVEQLAARMFPTRQDIPRHIPRRIFECELMLRASVASPPDELR
jgi:LacI family transcriptional regulator